MENYGFNGYMDFTKLWQLMQKKGHKKQWLIDHNIHRSTLYKLVNNQNVTCDALCRLCNLLNCQPGQIMEYVPKSTPDAEDT